MWYVEKIVNHRIGNRTQNKKIADSQGWTITIEESQTETAFDGSLWEKGFAPAQPIEEQNEAIRATRESLYMQTSDKLKADYDEAVARGADNVEELKKAWLASKDEIRANNPYIGGDNNGLQGQKTEVVDIID